VGHPRSGRKYALSGPYPGRARVAGTGGRVGVEVALRRSCALFACGRRRLGRRALGGGRPALHTHRAPRGPPPAQGRRGAGAPADGGRSALSARPEGEALRRWGEPAARVWALCERGLARPTRAAGRAFDAAADLAGLGDRGRFEGELAMRLQACVRRPRVMDIPVSPVLDLLPLFAALADSHDPRAAADLFHGTLAHALVRWARGSERLVFGRPCAHPTPELCAQRLHCAHTGRLPSWSGVAEPAGQFVVNLHTKVLLSQCCLLARTLLRVHAPDSTGSTTWSSS
jgi:hypothetical protein